MKKILGRLIIVAPAVIIQILWMNFLYNKLNNSALVTVLLTILAFLFVIYIINKRDETSYKILWLITILTAPVFGTILYLIIGNKKTTKPLDKKLKKAQNTMNFNFVDERNYGTELKQENLRLYQTFKAINKYTKFPIYKAENIKYYKLGDEMFPDILEELKKAQKYIFLEYFIIEPGIFLNSIIDILEQKVKDGVAFFAVRSGAKVIPCGIKGGTKGDWKMTITYGKPLDYSEYKSQAKDKEVLDKVTNEIMNNILELAK